MTDLDREAAKLQMSQTFHNLVNMAQNMPMDMSKMPVMPDDIKAALATSTNQMIDALDNDRIHFDSREDRAMFYGLLMVNMELFFEGKFASRAVRTTAKDFH
jgi:hypothetical protein